MMNLGLLFDMDGVLVDSEAVITHAAILALREFGISAGESDFKEFTGMGEDKFIGGVANKYGVSYDLAMKARTYELYGEVVDAQMKTYPQTLATLAILHQKGVPMALASSADRIKIDHNLRVAGIEPTLFSVILSGDDVKEKKPFPEIYQKAAQGLGIAPENCIVVEDALSGIAAGISAGCRVIGLTTSFDEDTLKQAGASWVFSHVGEIVPVVLSLFEKE